MYRDSLVAPTSEIFMVRSASPQTERDHSM